MPVRLVYTLRLLRLSVDKVLSCPPSYCVYDLWYGQYEAGFTVPKKQTYEKGWGAEGPGQGRSMILLSPGPGPSFFCSLI